MTESSPTKRLKRADFLEAARQEMIAFERCERKFRKKEREERAADLRLPLTSEKVHLLHIPK